MAQFGHSILDPKVVQPHETAKDPYAHDWLSTNVEGTAQGPFLLDSWQRGSQWVLKKNPNYYGQKPKVDQGDLQDHPERLQPARAAEERAPSTSPTTCR